MKVVIMDFDGTIYNGHMINCWIEYAEVFFNRFFKNNQLKKHSFFDKYDLEKNKYLSQEVACAFIKEYGSARKFVRYMNKFIPPLVAEDLRFVDEGFFVDLSKKVQLYIVSNSSTNYIKKHLLENGIRLKWFKGIYGNPYKAKELTKKYLYNKILRKEKVDVKDVLVVGDHEVNDLVPAKQLGCNTLLVKNISDLSNIYNQI